MKRKRRRRARLTPHEDYCWVFAFCYYLDEGFTDLQADKLTWRDMCDEFPRLKNYDGCLP